MIMKALYYRIKTYLISIWWVRKKNKEIKSGQKNIDMNLVIFRYRRSQGDSRDGTQDVSVKVLYKLRPISDGGMNYIVGNSVSNFAKLDISLSKAQKILDRFERRLKYKGFLNDKLAIAKANREIHTQKQKVIANELAGIQTFKSDISIPD